MKTTNLLWFPKSRGYWNSKQNVLQFLSDVKRCKNLQTIDDWNSITQKEIRLFDGGHSILNKYSLYELKCMACPNGSNFFKKSINLKPSGYWDNKQNVIQFLEELKQNYNLNTIKDWNSITQKQIRSLHGGNLILHKYSMYELKCMGFPEGKLLFNKSIQYKSSNYWNDEKNVKKFLDDLKIKLNLNTLEDWNLITQKTIKLNGGSSLLHKYSMYDLKSIGFPEGKLFFKKSKQLIKTNKKPIGFWNNENNILQFLNDLKIKLNLNTLEDWNLITQKEIKLHGGSSLLKHYSMNDLKCLGFPEGKIFFNNSTQQSTSNNKSHKSLDKNQQNPLVFLEQLKIKLNLKTFEDWNLITQKIIILNGGSSFLKLYSMYDLKCLGFPDGKFLFKKPILQKFNKKPIGYWDNEDNVLQFLDKVKEKFKLSSIDDWNSITQFEISSLGGGRLLNKYSMYEIKCLACPEGKLLFNKPNQSKPSGYWDDENNKNLFLDQLKNTFNLKSPLDWNRLSKNQIISIGGGWLFDNRQYLKKTKETFEIQSDNDKKLISFSLHELLYPNKYLLTSNKRFFKRSAQRWLFLQIQKLFPHEEIVEDYFHSDISRDSGSSVQFDIFLTKKNVAFEYHGLQHYEDIPSAFASLEMYKNRDLEKGILCSKYGIQLVVIPYWWDNKLKSLKETLYSTLENEELRLFCNPAVKHTIK